MNNIVRNEQRLLATAKMVNIRMIAGAALAGQELTDLRDDTEAIAHAEEEATQENMDWIRAYLASEEVRDLLRDPHVDHDITSLVATALDIYERPAGDVFVPTVLLLAAALDLHLPGPGTGR